MFWSELHVCIDVTFCQYAKIDVDLRPINRNVPALERIHETKHPSVHSRERSRRNRAGVSLPVESSSFRESQATVRSHGDRALTHANAPPASSREWQQNERASARRSSVAIVPSTLESLLFRAAYGGFRAAPQAPLAESQAPWVQPTSQYMRKPRIQPPHYSGFHRKCKEFGPRGTTPVQAPKEINMEANCEVL